MSTSIAATDAVHQGHDQSVHDPTPYNFGVASNGKIGMWIFLLSDAMSFAGLLIGYGILRAGTKQWPIPSEVLGIPLTAALTFLLICSSVTMVLAVAASQEGNRKATSFWLAMTILGGVLFLFGQRHEYTELIHQGMTLSQCAVALPGGGVCPPQFASTFYVITSFHGMHVFTGVVYLTVILIQTMMGWYDHGRYNRIEIVGLFWHFVDLVWILVFTFVYLL